MKSIQTFDLQVVEEVYADGMQCTPSGGVSFSDKASESRSLTTVWPRQTESQPSYFRQRAARPASILSYHLTGAARSS